MQKHLYIQVRKYAKLKDQHVPGIHTSIKPQTPLARVATPSNWREGKSNAKWQASDTRDHRKEQTTNALPACNIPQAKAARCIHIGISTRACDT